MPKELTPGFWTLAELQDLRMEAIDEQRRVCARFIESKVVRTPDGNFAAPVDELLQKYADEMFEHAGVHLQDAVNAEREACARVAEACLNVSYNDWIPMEIRKGEASEYRV